MNIILLGAPGAGKGTQAFMIAEKYGIPHISTGDIFRSNIREGTTLGKKAASFIDKGLLVPDELTCDIVVDRLNEKDCENGFILDGFPRTIPQADALGEALEKMGRKISAAIDFEVPDDHIVERMSGRRVCTSCSESYHIVHRPPAKENVCDHCGSPLEIRPDDIPETVRKRLEVYHKQTQPLIAYYKERNVLITIDGTREMDDVFGDVTRALEDL